MDATQLTALTGFITGVIGVIIAALTYRSAATKEELNSLRQTILALTQENKRLQERVQELEDENESLRKRIDTLENENHRLRKPKN